jgi:hypothetical protein
MTDFEKLGVFYLGRPYDLAAKQPKEGLTLYDSKDLVTHAVCVGMTGSGKTGLCTDLLEEAAIDGIPSIVIDPKGDMTNLMLAFPGLTAQEFRPWINEDEARNKDMSSDDFAQAQADLWKKGLAGWGQDGARIRKYRDSVDMAIYTPGSTAGLPVSILKSFAVPPANVMEDSELLTERINTTTTGLLTLLKIDADPVRSREHILISNILSYNWQAGRDLDLAALIQQIQTPPMTRIGVIDIESVYPSAQRFELAMRLNNLLAAPGFHIWLDGAPLDIGGFLYTPSGKPRISIFYIAHLSDPERMFFVSLLLGQVLGWVRSQSGTTSLRSILYMDEIFGYFPPTANPPSKTPLLTLLKQARAFGMGIVLATQNPVDLDYKGLSNAGTWFLGRLQTERDKARVLDGLEGVATSSGGSFDRGQIDRILSGLGKRVFLLHNVNKSGPEIFETRWAMSYLRGPLTRDQIKVLMAPIKAAMPASPPVDASVAASGATAASVRAGGPAPSAANTAMARPVLPPTIEQYFTAPTSRGAVVYTPMLYGAAQISFANDKLGVSVTNDVAYMSPILDGAVAVEWDNAEETDVTADGLRTEPERNAAFASLPTAGARPQSYAVWKAEFSRWLQRTQTLELLSSRRLGVVSKPEESEREFRFRLQMAAREQRDELKEKLRKKYEVKIATLNERRRKAQQAVDREKAQANQSKLSTAVSVGAGIFGALFGGGRSSIGRAATAARGVSRTMKESGDIARAKETVAALDAQIKELEAQFEADVETAVSASEALTEQLEKITLKPKTTGVSVRVLGLVWVAG